LQSAAPFQSIQVNLQNSPSGVKIVGEDPATTRELWEAHANPEFYSTSLVGQIDGVQVSININFGNGIVSVNLQPQAAAYADPILDVVRGRFPFADGLPSHETQRRQARLQELIEVAASAATAADDASSASEQAIESSRSAASQAEVAADAARQSASRKDETEARLAEASDLVAKIQAASSEAAANRDATKQARDDSGPIRAELQAFSADLASERSRLDQAISEAEESKSNSQAIIDRHTELQLEIEEALQKAVGAGLFGSFEERKNQVVRSKWIWAGISLALSAAQVAVIVWVVEYVSALEALANLSLVSFGLRLAASLPIIGALIYSIRQYSRERHFEELYAFKSALSFSLKPYLDLVEELPKVEAEHHQQFATETIRQIFEFPEDRSKQSRSRRAVRAEIKQMTELLKSLGNTIE